MEINDFINKVINEKNKIITDEVFLLIQNNHELMQDYLRLVEEKGLDEVNRQIGKGIKACYNLANDVEREADPKSTLISSYQMHS